MRRVACCTCSGMLDALLAMRNPRAGRGVDGRSRFLVEEEDEHGRVERDGHRLAPRFPARVSSKLATGSGSDPQVLLPSDRKAPMVSARGASSSTLKPLTTKRSRLQTSSPDRRQLPRPCSRTGGAKMCGASCRAVVRSVPMAVTAASPDCSVRWTVLSRPPIRTISPSRYPSSRTAAYSIGLGRVRPGNLRH